jgi:hypothetical protein
MAPDLSGRRSNLQVEHDDDAQRVANERVVQSFRDPLLPNGLSRDGRPQSAPKAVLFEEAKDDPLGKSYTGVVSWHTQMDLGNLGTNPRVALRADVDLPNGKMKVLLSMTPNDENSLGDPDK